MAKISFTKLKLTKKNEVQTLKYNDEIIEVKQYLPIQDKLALISRVINYAADEYNFANCVKLDLFLSLEIMYCYTNINFTEKQKEDPTKLYDLLEENGLIDAVISLIPHVEYSTLYDGVLEISKNIYAYQTSVLGILDTVNKDYSNLNLDATEIEETIKNPDNLRLVKNVIDKLG